MNPLRLVILGVLFYILFKLLFGKKNISGRGPDRSGRGMFTPAATQDVLVEDPVCHTYIPKGQAVPLQQNGIIHYFCSDACRKKFQPEQQGE